MKFRTRIIMVYAAFVLTITVLLGGLFYYYSVERSVSREMRDMEDMSRQLAQQYDESIKAMKNVSQYILSDADTLRAIRELSGFPADADYVSLYFNEAMGEVRDGLNTDYILNNFYRTIFFNENGVVVSTIHSAKKMDAAVNIGSLPWIDKMAAVEYGDFAVLGPHKDDWGEKKQEVFSVVKELQGNNLGYIEVQKTGADLAALLEISSPDIKVLLIDEAGGILYSNTAYAGDAGYETLLTQHTSNANRYQNTITGDEEFLAVSKSKETGASLIVAKQYNIIQGELWYISIITITLAVSFIGLAALYIVIASNHLAKPVKELNALMEKTDIDNMAENVGLETSNDEIELLRQSYESMMKRLDSAIVQEKRTSAMQFQAQFDALQAQVNPHFIYNILNVISSRGALREDEVVCEICDGLAAMLRYSTNIKERYATVEQEVEYLETYIKLLKCRYEHKLEYHIDVEAGLMKYILPKIALQQLAENSVSHGYENGLYPVMRLEVTGWQDDKGWYVQVRDNGDGFSPQALQHVREEIEKIKQQIRSVDWNVELEIGGMGIANTFARLYLLYADQLVFTVDNYNRGAEVFFCIRKREEGRT